MLRKIALFAAALFLTSISSHAVLTLTVDTTAKTVSWSGDETSGTITTTPFTFGLDIIVATAWTPNPTGATPYIQMGTDGLLMTDHTTTITNGIVSEGQPRLYVDGNNGILSVVVATMVDIDGGGESTVTVTGDMGGYDYATAPIGGLSPAQLNTLEGANGSQLRFYRVDDQFADLGAAGMVIVIPEPGAAQLLGLALAVLLVRRRR